MWKQYLLAGVFGLFSCVASWQANAALITTTYQLSVTESEHGIDIGSILEISATYDQSSSYIHTYSDGLNQKGEFGQGDDITYEMICLDTYSDPDDLCDGLVENMLYIADVKWNLSAIEAFIPAELRGTDEEIFNWSQILAGPDYIESSLALDDLHFNLYIDSEYHTATIYTYSEGSIWTDGKGLGTRYTSFDLLSLATTSVFTVPEPSTLAIFGIGILSFGFGRRLA